MGTLLLKSDWVRELPGELGEGISQGEVLGRQKTSLFAIEHNARCPVVERVEGGGLQIQMYADPAAKQLNFLFREGESDDTVHPGGRQDGDPHSGRVQCAQQGETRTDPSRGSGCGGIAASSQGDGEGASGHVESAG